MEIRHFFKCTLALLLLFHSASFAQQTTQNVTQDIPPAWGNRSVRVINPFGQGDNRSSKNSPNRIVRKDLAPSRHVISNQVKSRGQDRVRVDEGQLEMLPMPQLEQKADNHRASRVALVGPLNSHVEKTSRVWESPATSYSNHDSNTSPLNYRETPHGELSINSSATHPAAFESAPRPEYEPIGVESTATNSFQIQQPALPIHNHQAEYHSAAPCVDEWAGFCQPKNMAWECDCRLIPRPDRTLAGCRSCRGNRCLLPRPGIFARRSACGCTATNCNCNSGESNSHPIPPQSLQPSQEFPATDHGADSQSNHFQSNQSRPYTNANTVKGAVPTLFGEIQAARKRNATGHQGGLQQQQPACLQCGLSGANCRCNRR